MSPCRNWQTRALTTNKELTSNRVHRIRNITNRIIINIQIIDNNVVLGETRPIIDVTISGRNFAFVLEFVPLFHRSSPLIRRGIISFSQFDEYSSPSCLARASYYRRKWCESIYAPARFNTRGAKDSLRRANENSVEILFLIKDKRWSVARECISDYRQFVEIFLRLKIYTYVTLKDVEKMWCFFDSLETCWRNVVQDVNNIERSIKLFSKGERLRPTWALFPALRKSLLEIRHG